MYQPTIENTSPVSSFPLAIIVGTYNKEITDSLRDRTVAQLIKRGFIAADIHICEVPGALEIPLVAKKLAKSGTVEAIIALGSVIRGDTSHYDLVCDRSSESCMQVSLETEIPLIFGVLTTENEEQAWDRLGGKAGDKGIEMANTAIHMHQLLKKIA